MNKNAFLKQIILLIDEMGRVQGGMAIDYFTYIMKDDMIDSPPPRNKKRVMKTIMNVLGHQKVIK